MYELCIFRNLAMRLPWLPWLPWLIPHVSYRTRHWHPVAKAFPIPSLEESDREREFGHSAVGNIAVRSGGCLMTGRQRAMLEIVILGFIPIPCG